MAVTTHPCKQGTITCDVHWDKEHGYFSTTAAYRDRPHGKVDPELWPEELRPLLRWHLFDAHGPLHYVSNTLYHISNRDTNGLLEGETKPVTDRHGNYQWVLESTRSCCWGTEEPPPVKWVKRLRIGEGKERRLDYARSTAAWPEATDEELLAATAETLMTRLPALMRQFVTECREYIPADVYARWAGDPDAST